MSETPAVYDENSQIRHKHKNTGNGGDPITQWLPSEEEAYAKTDVSVDQAFDLMVLRMKIKKYEDHIPSSDVYLEFIDETLEIQPAIGGKARKQQVEVLKAFAGAGADDEGYWDRIRDVANDA